MDNKVPAIITNPNEVNININIGVNNVSIIKSLGSISKTLLVTLSALTLSGPDVFWAVEIFFLLIIISKNFNNY